MKKLLFAVLLFACCSKEEPITEANKRLASALDSTLQHNYYRLNAYYTLQPFDYDPTDTVSAKTNHWEYVSWWLKDDEVGFSNNQVTIIQHANMMPMEMSDIIYRSYKVRADSEGVAFDYLNFTYEPLTYRLIEMTDSSLVVKAPYNGTDVYSIFKVLP